ncbi:Ribonuclease 2 [Entamoeba marina]
MLHLLFTTLIIVNACDYTPSTPCNDFTIQKPSVFAYFVQSWPGTFCSDNCCHAPIQPTTGFSIHGFWPQYNSTTYPTCCYTDQTSESVHNYITTHTDLQNTLAYYWPSLKRCNFFDYEYLKHGTCIPQLSSGIHGPQYFADVSISLREKYDIWKNLYEQGIKDDLTQYSTETIRKMIKDIVGVTPLLFCSGLDFDEMRLCSNIPTWYERKSATLISCDESFQSTETCGDFIRFPPYPTINITDVCDY